MAIGKTKKRTDHVRERRNKRGRRKPVRIKNKRQKTAMRTAAPTVVRTRSMAQVSGRRKNSKQARKRSYLPLGTPGAEIRLPAMPAVQVGWRLGSGVLTLTMMFTLYTLLNSSSLHVGLVEVSGIERITSQDVNAVLSVFGASIFSLEPDVLQQELKAAFPEMTDVSVQVGFPAWVTVEASERQPQLVWEQGEILLWVDSNGVAFRPRGEAQGLVRVQATQAPPLLGDETRLQDQIITPEMVQAILTLSHQAPTETDLLYDSEHGLGWRDPQGWQVFFGPNPDNMEVRLTIYQAMVGMFQERNIKPVMISLEYLHAPYYRMVSDE
jgi:cell division septal protein FtsQ